MNIVLKYIFTNVKEHKTRTFVMLLSILLSTMLLFVSFSIGISYENAQKKMACGMAGRATISVQTANKKININSIPNISTIKAKVGILEGTSIYQENGYYETIDLIAADLAGLNQINKPRLQSGGEISGFSGNQIILPDRFTSKYEIKKGDMITIYINGKPFKFELIDIAAYDTTFLRQTRGATALLPLSTLGKLLGQTDAYSKILIEPAKNIETNTLIEQLNDLLPKDNYQVSEVVNEKKITANARQKSMPFFLISFFSLTMSIFIIYSSYKVITLDRLPIIGTFRSIGATKKIVSFILIMESILYGCLGGLLGIPTGILVLKLILQGMGKSFNQGIEIPIVISLPGILLSFSIGVIVSLISAWFPVHRASCLPIKDIILGTVEGKKLPNNYIVGIGSLLFILSVFLPKIVSGNMIYLIGGFSLLGIIIAAILVIPLLTNLASVGLEHLYSLIFKNEGRLAARNMKDNKNINQNITLLCISISAIIVITVVGNFVTTYVSDVFHNAKLQGFADGHMEQNFINKVKKMEGIQDVLPVYVFNNKLSGNKITFSRLETTDDLELYTSMFALNFTNSTMEQESISFFEAKKRSIILSKDFLDHSGFSIGDTITLSNGITKKSYTVTGSFKSRATDVEGVIPSAYAVSDYNASSYNFLAYTATNPDAIMIQIRDLFGNTTNWSRTVEEFNHDALSTVGAFLDPLHKMTYFILLLAAVGIINNLLINYMQRRHTIAMYKSVGLSNRQHIKMTLIEGFSCGFIGSVIALIVSYMEIKTIFIVAGPKIQMIPELNICIFLGAGILGIIITLLGELVPIFKSRNMNLVEEIKFE